MDELLRISLLEGQARAMLVKSAALVEEARKIHDLSRTATAALGRLLTGTAMLGAMLKSPTDSVTVSIRGNGPMGRLLSVGAPDGTVKGYVEHPEVDPERRNGKLNVGGAFHSPLMEPARVELEAAIREAPFATPVCPVYQNVDAKPYTDPEKIKANLIAQLTAPVRWTQIVRNMLADGADSFTELGPGAVLQGLIKKVDKEAACESKQTL